MPHEHCSSATFVLFHPWVRLAIPGDHEWTLIQWLYRSPSVPLSPPCIDGNHYVIRLSQPPLQLDRWRKISREWQHESKGNYIQHSAIKTHNKSKSLCRKSSIKWTVCIKTMFFEMMEISKSKISTSTMYFWILFQSTAWCNAKRVAKMRPSFIRKPTQLEFPMVSVLPTPGGHARHSRKNYPLMHLIHLKIQ
jgi:hypothetical protein